MKLSQTVETLQLLGDESRLRLCALLGARELCVSDLVRITGHVRQASYEVQDATRYGVDVIAAGCGYAPKRNPGLSWRKRLKVFERIGYSGVPIGVDRDPR